MENEWFRAQRVASVLLIILSAACAPAGQQVMWQRTPVNAVVLDERETHSLKVEVAALPEVVHEQAAKVLTKRGFELQVENPAQLYIETDWNTTPRRPQRNQSALTGIVTGLVFLMKFLTLSYDNDQTMVKLDVNPASESSSAIVLQAYHRHTSGSFLASRPSRQVIRPVDPVKDEWEHKCVSDLLSATRLASEVEMADRADPPPGGVFSNRFGVVKRRSWRGDAWWVGGP